MKKLVKILVLTAVTVALSAPALAASSSRSYTISVTIPPVVKIDENKELTEKLGKIIVKEYDISDYNFVILVRNDEKVYMRSIVVQ